MKRKPRKSLAAAGHLADRKSVLAALVELAEALLLESDRARIMALGERRKVLGQLLEAHTSTEIIDRLDRNDRGVKELAAQLSAGPTGAGAQRASFAPPFPLDLDS